ESIVQQEIQIFQQPTTIVEKLQIIGQYHTTYILVETENGLLLIDQHAAHERILYERFTDNAQTLESIQLLFPVFISVTQSDLQLITPHLELLVQNGIAIEPLSDQQLVISAVPAPLKNVDFNHLIHHCIGWIHEYEHLEKTALNTMMREKLHAQMACK